MAAVFGATGSKLESNSEQKQIDTYVYGKRECTTNGAWLKNKKLNKASLYTCVHLCAYLDFPTYKGMFFIFTQERSNYGR